MPSDCSKQRFALFQFFNLQELSVDLFSAQWFGWWWCWLLWAIVEEFLGKQIGCRGEAQITELFDGIG